MADVIDSPIFTGDFHRVVTDYERQLRHHQWVVERYEVCRVAQHEPHTYREGFLWHRKVKCPGVPAKRKRHRHFFRLTTTPIFYNALIAGRVEPEMIVWQCKCEAYLMARRDVVKEAMIPNVRKADQVWPG